MAWTAAITAAITAGGAVLLAMSSPAQAAPLLFDFEEFSTGSRSSLLMTRGGSSVTVSRTSGAALAISDISSLGPPPGWGSRTLLPATNQTLEDGFLFDLSLPAQRVSIETTDYFGDSDLVSLTAYDGPGGTGAIVDAMMIDWGDQGPPAAAVLTTSSPSIRSVVARGGSMAYPASMYWDNLTIEPVPGPGPLVGAGVTVGFCRRLRDRIRSRNA